MKRWIGYVACLILVGAFACAANEDLPERAAHIEKVRIRASRAIVLCGFRNTLPEKRTPEIA